MKRSFLAMTTMAAGLSLMLLGAGCSGSASGSAQGGGASAEAEVAVEIKATGNPKYDKFFADLNDLYKRVKKAERALDRAPKALAKAAALAETTDFKAALEGVAAKLKGKVTVKIEVTEKGATVTAGAAAGVTLSAEEQAMLEAYKEAVMGVGEVPVLLADVAVKAADLIKQAVMLLANVKNDFTGLNAIKTGASLLSGIPKAQKIIPELKDKTPVLIEKAKNYLETVKAVTIG